MTEKFVPIRVLIVEDEETTAQHLTDLLQERFDNIVLEPLTPSRELLSQLAT